jgi:hypothetical protein
LGRGETEAQGAVEVLRRAAELPAFVACLARQKRQLGVVRARGEELFPERLGGREVGAGRELAQQIAAGGRVGTLREELLHAEGGLRHAPDA